MGKRGRSSNEEKIGLIPKRPRAGKLLRVYTPGYFQMLARLHPLPTANMMSLRVDKISRTHGLENDAELHDEKLVLRDHKA
ncbi:hypothetical protein STEG23_000450 [Scotinomys teguina]